MKEYINCHWLFPPTRVILSLPPHPSGLAYSHPSTPLFTILYTPFFRTGRSEVQADLLGLDTPSLQALDQTSRVPALQKRVLWDRFDALVPVRVCHQHS